MSIYSINSVCRGQFIFKEPLSLIKDGGFLAHFHKGVTSWSKGGGKSYIIQYPTLAHHTRGSIRERTGTTHTTEATTDHTGTLMLPEQILVLLGSVTNYWEATKCHSSFRHWGLEVTTGQRAALHEAYIKGRSKWTVDKEDEGTY